MSYYNYRDPKCPHIDPKLVKYICNKYPNEFIDYTPVVLGFWGTPTENSRLILRAVHKYKHLVIYE